MWIYQVWCRAYPKGIWQLYQTDLMGKTDAQKVAHRLQKDASENEHLDFFETKVQRISTRTLNRWMGYE